jgi:non-canonical poly(A) RNA polymerase PAPD5/7
MLQLMIVGFLQHRERDAFNYRRSGLNNLGAMLLEFLELYGMQFNYMTTCMSIRHDGFFFPKGAADRKEIFWQPSRPFSMALENPLDTTADVGKASFRIGMIQRAFAVAYKMVLANTATPLEPTMNGSILETILPPTSEMRERAAMRQQLGSATDADERPSKRHKQFLVSQVSLLAAYTAIGNTLDTTRVSSFMCTLNIFSAPEGCVASRLLQ